jgi:F0F1-type ATP synthase assembly protein I
MEFITENFKIIILALIGLFAGIAITIKVRKGNKTNNSYKANQKNNKVGGDMAGRDINK